MSQEFLSAKEAASRLSISTTTLDGWLGESDYGLLVIRGRSVSIEYFQAGRKGQGRIQIGASEVDRLRELMRVHPKPNVTRRPPTRHDDHPGITVPLGMPKT